LPETVHRREEGGEEVESATNATSLVTSHGSALGRGEEEEEGEGR